jgi:hypothetical chaperone protein
MRHKIAPHFGADVTYRAPFGSNVLPLPSSLLERLCSPAEVCLLHRSETMRLLADIRAGALGEHDAACIDRLVTLIEDALGFSIFEAIERTKCVLSERVQAPFVFEYPSADVRDTVSRAEFEHHSTPMTERILACLDATLAAAGLAPGDVDLVCPTGGTSLVPAIARELDARFGAHKIHRLSSFHSVVQGLAERARAFV